ncbi:MAG: hypothetical protein HC888_06790, partial [Candidatus Competibacteraceae bacterium]|nr:hypothetical protein [Candidatus Competibacteraceae bacterium]
MGVRAAFVSGETELSERRETLYRFKTGEITHLSGCDLFLEGYDEPSIECVAMLRPTTSRALYSQAVGRGTRRSPGKTRLLLLEFTFNSQKLKLVEPYELFTAPEYNERVRARAKSAPSEEEVDYLGRMDDAHEVEYNIKNIIERTIIPSFETVEFDPVGFAAILGVDFSPEMELLYKNRKLRGRITPKQYSSCKS